MSVWGKLLAGTFGFALGGPIGALLGVIAGHSVDKIRQNTNYNAKDMQGFTEELITIGVIILSAKLAKSDGQVSKEEIKAFKEKFKIPDNFNQNVGKIYNEASKSSEDFESYASQLGNILSHQKIALEQIINLLFYIASSDGNISNEEINFIKKCSELFKLQPHKYSSIAEMWISQNNDPYKILGVTPNESDATIRKKWLELNKELHPDQLRSQGVPQELLLKSEDRLSEINQAYDKIKSLRKN